MALHDLQPETPAQWMEHTDAWRYDHLDLAPSDVLRREAVAAHDLLERARAAALQGEDGTPLLQMWLRLPLLTRQMVLMAIVVVVVAVGAFLA